LTVGNLDQAVQFWALFGFREVEKRQGYARLQFYSLLDKKVFFLEINEDCNRPLVPIFLDDPAFNCLAFITTSVIKEKELLSKKGAQTTPIASLVVNGTKLNIFFVRGPQYELVEVIGFEK